MNISQWIEASIKDAEKQHPKPVKLTPLQQDLSRIVTALEQSAKPK